VPVASFESLKPDANAVVFVKMVIKHVVIAAPAFLIFFDIFFIILSSKFILIQQDNIPLFVRDSN
jgi:hypothetical protein